MEKQGEESIEQDAIFLNIYTSCDVQNTENVSVSVLMNFIAPYIGTNSQHLEELKRLLYATNSAPVINKTTFLNVMQIWSEKCQNGFEVNESTSEDAVQINSNSTTNLDNSDTVTENFDRDLNTSNVSGYSLTGSTISSTEPINWQEMIRELQHNNKKLNESLVDVRNQVSILEEQNESLHSSLVKFKKCRQSDQTLIKTLQKKCSDLERDHEDNANITNKHLNTIQKLASSKKELGQLQIRIEELEQESKQNAETIADHQNLVLKEKNTNQYLQSEVEQRDLVITEFQDKQIELKRQISNLEFTTKQYVQENEHLQEKVQSLELQLEKSIKNNNIALQSEGGSGTESALPSEKPINNSLSPEEFWGRPSSPHENLHSELIKIADTKCLISCEHKLRLTECKEEAEKVLMELYNKNNSAKSEILQIEEKLSNAEKFSAKLIKKNHQFKRRLKFFKSSLLQNVSQCIEKSKELEELKSELGKIKKEKEELNQMAVEHEQLVLKVGMLSNENNELKKEINPKKTKIEQLELKLHQDRKNIFEYKQKNEQYAQEIQNLNDRIENLKINNKQLNNEYESLFSHVKTASQIIKDSRGFLKMNTLLTTDIWKTVIKMLIPDQNIEDIINISILNNDTQNIKGPLQEEIIFLNNEIRQTVNILKALAKIRKKMKVSTATDSSPTSDLKCLLNFRNNAKSSDNESIFSKLTPKRFFLKHPSSSTPRNSPFIPPSSMSPECSASDMTDTASGTASESTVFIETNNNEIPLIMAQKEEEEPVAYQNGGLSSEKSDEIVSRENDLVRINDSKIEAIFKEHRLQEPLEKIEESTLLSPEEDSENNSGYKSDSAFDISENGAQKGAKKKLKKGVQIDVEEDVREKLARKYRSMSEGAVISHQLLADGDVVVFPNLKSETLDAMGLLPNGQPNHGPTRAHFQRASDRRRNRTKVPAAHPRVCYRCGHFRRSSRKATSTARPSRGQPNQGGNKVHTSGSSTQSPMCRRRNHGVGYQSSGAFGSHSAGHTQDLNKCGDFRQRSTRMEDIRLSEYDDFASSKCHSTTGYYSTSTTMHQTYAPRERNICIRRPTGDFDTASINIEHHYGSRSRAHDTPKGIHRNHTTTVGFAQCQWTGGFNRYREEGGCSPGFCRSVRRTGRALLQTFGLQASPRMEERATQPAFAVQTTQPTRVRFRSLKNSGGFY